MLAAFGLSPLNQGQVSFSSAAFEVFWMKFRIVPVHTSNEYLVSYKDLNNQGLNLNN